MTEPILALREVHTYIAQHHILQGVSFEVKPGRATVLLGRNGAGKSTTLRTVMGLTPARLLRARFGLTEKPLRDAMFLRLHARVSDMYPKTKRCSIT
jgi:ABC-type branched-subunit amino acid transport system ATPase component